VNRRERSDAARNRRAILDVAERLITERGVDAVSMDDIASEAGVGKGTLFRRFGDRAGLMKALVDKYRDERIEATHEASRHATTATQRTLAFVAVLTEHVLRRLPLIAALERAAGEQRYLGANFRETHRQLAELIAEARHGHGDAQFLAHVVLNTMRADLIIHLTRRCGMTEQHLAAEILTLTRLILDVQKPTR
jgi:AcrR family transcriptional regulator